MKQLSYRMMAKQLENMQDDELLMWRSYIQSLLDRDE